MIHCGFQDQADYCCRHLSSTYNSPGTGLERGAGRLGIYPMTPNPLTEVSVLMDGSIFLGCTLMCLGDLVALGKAGTEI